MKHWIVALLTIGLCAASLTACDELDFGGLIAESGNTTDAVTDTTEGTTTVTSTGGTSTDDTTSEENTNHAPEDDNLPAVDNVGTEHLVGQPITEREWEKMLILAEDNNYSYKWTVVQNGVTRVSYGCVDGGRWLERVFEDDVEVERRGEFSVGADLLYHTYDFEDHTWVQANGGRTFSHPISSLPVSLADLVFNETTGTYTYRVPTDKTYTDEQIAAGAGAIALRFFEGECIYIATADTNEEGNLDRMSFEFWSYGRTMVVAPESIQPDSTVGGGSNDSVSTAPSMPDHNENIQPEHPGDDGSMDTGKLPPDHSVDTSTHPESSAESPENSPSVDDEALVDSAPEAVLPPSPPDDEVVSNKPYEPDEPSADEDNWIDLNGNGTRDEDE